jgi:hypothetical protein
MTHIPYQIFPILQAFIKLTNVKSNEVYFQQKLNVCTLTDKPVVGIFLKPFMDYFRQFANFNLRCPFKKGSQLRIKSFPMDNAYIAPFLPLETQRSFSMMVKGGRKSKPLLALTVYFMRIEVDD